MSADTPHTLRRRNEAWKRLRSAEPFSPEFEAALAELQAIVRWPRERILAGLGLEVEHSEHPTSIKP